ncbi:prephenate dehydratase domain-containing protein [Aeromicrobium sp. UC242_57]|uniref:prephenate dehydratase domain-containing protein n=1 Tax=Aeromicrobium sp. UC242_57 TaxID=3374624 RepID=UPI0037A07878
MTSRRIAYQGEPGANSHIVANRHYPDWDTLPCASFEDVFAAVESGEAELAMIPIDNSIAGRVADIHHFLPTSGLHIIAEHFLRIQFSLMAMPGVTIDQIKTVHSHVHALGQCRKIIREHGLTPVISGDTAGAAREIAAAGDPTQAAISPPMAAEIYGLDVLAHDIEDEDHNTTRFVVLSPRTGACTGWQRPDGHDVRVQRPQPAGRPLQGSGRLRHQRRQHDQAQSYMVDGEFTATQFLAEVDGHPDDLPLARALERLTFFTTDITVMGVYPADPFRAASR